MWNRPVRAAASSVGESFSRRWETDARPGRRLAWLFGVLLVPFGLIVGRLVYLQGVLSIGFFDPQDATTVTYEWIPARCGRILSRDGRILAEDVVLYEIHAHYRWLESPPNASWVRRRALSQLDRAQRRDRVSVRQQEERVRAEQTAVWKRLVQLTGKSKAEIDRARSDVQQRIERMLDSVRRRRDERRSEELQERLAEEEVDDAEPFTHAWKTIVRELTTPPERGRTDLLVLPEQSDYHKLLEDVSPRIAAEIEAHPELYPGLRVRMTSRRYYPARTLAAHLIGHRVPRKLKPPSPTKDSIDGSVPPIPAAVGVSGLEQSYDGVLRGRPGLRRVLRNHRGEVLRTNIVQKPQPGRDIVVTLDAQLQDQAERMLDRHLQPPKATQPKADPAASPTVPRGGSIVVLDVRTGAILAAASAPRFDLNVFVDGDKQQWDVLKADKRQPFFPRALRMTLAPGSVFKVVSAVAAIESGKIDPDMTHHCRGYLDQPHRHRCYIYRHFGVGHGDLNLTDALCRSCNVYFYQAARTMGPGPLIAWSRRFGIGQPTGVDVPGERSGNLPSPFESGPPNGPKGARHRWYPGDTLGLAIGQSRLTTTPLQIARMMAAIGNSGFLVTPHLLSRIDAASRSSDSSTTGLSFPRLRIPNLSESTLKQVQRGLWKVVQDSHGTGFKHVRLNGIEIAGKTGTAEVGGGKPDHAWFAGYAPAKNPRVAFVVVLEHAGSGGREAGPVARELVQYLLKNHMIRGAVAMRNQ